MKRTEVSQATNSLGQYARELEQDPLVLTEGGHAIAVLVPLEDADLESLALSLSPKFQAVIERARAEYRAGASLSEEDVRRERGIQGPGSNASGSAGRSLVEPPANWASGIRTTSPGVTAADSAGGPPRWIPAHPDRTPERVVPGQTLASLGAPARSGGIGRNRSTGGAGPPTGPPGAARAGRVRPCHWTL